MTSLGEDEKTPVDRIARNPFHEGIVRALTNNISMLDSLRTTLVVHRDDVRDRVDPMPTAVAGALARAYRGAQDSAGAVAREYELLRDGGGNGGGGKGG